jgi:hypothetical protein
LRARLILYSDSDHFGIFLAKLRQVGFQLSQLV